MKIVKFVILHENDSLYENDTVSNFKMLQSFYMKTI